MNLEEIKQFFETNKDNQDVQNYLQGLSQVTPDGVKTFLETDEGKKLIQPKLDSHFSKGLETWKQNQLQKIIDDEIAKRNPQETPEQKMLREMQDKITKMEQEKTRETLKNIALTQMSEKKLPASLVDYLIGQDQESTISNLSKFEEVFNTHIQSAVQEKLKTGGTSLNGGNPPTTFTKEQIANMTPDQINANWEAISQMKL